MIRKAISALLIVCLVSNFVSCYSSKTEIIYDLSKAFPQYDSISVHTKDGNVFTFRSGSVVDNTFIGIDEMSNATEIELKDILYFELTTRELSEGKTLLLSVGVLLIAAAVALAVLVVVASCPHVSTFDGKNWILEAEPNGGAITKSTEYIDYNVMSRLKAHEDGTYKIRLENNLEEIDFNNELKLLAVDHDAGLRILNDVHGNLLAVSEVIRPYHAMTDGGVDLLQEYGTDGSLFWDGDIQKIEYDRKHPRDEIHLKFKRPDESSKCILVFEGSSTFWSTFIMADFLSKFGKSAAARFKRLENDPRGREKVDRFMKKSGYFIEVSLRSNGDWVDTGYFKAAGSYASKAQALQIDLPENIGEIVEIRLRYAPYFWNIMELGMGFSAGNENLRVAELAPVKAIDTKRGDIRELLLAKDDLYYRAEQGDRAEISFTVPPLEENLERTLILKTSGYYEFVLDEEKEMPFLSKVWQAVKGQGIDGYSLEKYQEIREKAGF